MIHWTAIEPREAVDIILPMMGIYGPVNEVGKPCPWPWEPQQLTNAAFGQYHCPYCGGMQMAGLKHIDWSGEDGTR